jgi:predicted AlkP superfamily phosphohydrolase/phosphomutase
MLSGLGVPDLKGLLGQYTFYTSEGLAEDKERKGQIIYLKPQGQTIKTQILGPPIARLTGKKISQIPLEIRLDQENRLANLRIDGKEYTLREGELSGWIGLKFGIGMFKHVRGICQFYLDSVRPELRLYLSPIQLDPEQPAFVISHPDGYAAQLAKSIGTYHTLGMPEDTNALKDGLLNQDVFLRVCDTVMMEREKMLWYELGRFKEGVLAFVFDTTDRIQHMFWSVRDPEHPTYDEAFAKRYRDVIGEYYRQVDRIVGRVLDSIDQHTLLIILSDHGFASFRRAVHLNSWLVQNGFMVLGTPEGSELFKDVIWEKTKAYALGFSSIYLNLRGREGRGVVDPGDEAQRLGERIAEGLTQLRDPDRNTPVIKRIYTRQQIYQGDYLSEAPDLIVGFEPGYRTSWQTAIGGAPHGILQDNLKRWSGDHLVDPGYVPGVLFVNHKISVPSPSLIDIAPTILGCFGLPKPDEMEGTSLLH